MFPASEFFLQAEADYRRERLMAGRPRHAVRRSRRTRRLTSRRLRSALTRRDYTTAA